MTLLDFPGGTAVSQLQVYDWPASDGLRGGSPHVHTVSTEGYVILRGEGVLQALSGDGYSEHRLAPGSLLWFTPGTIHRLVKATEVLEILVVMQNSGLPEAGDAVLTFPDEILAEPAAYARAAALQAVSEVEAGPGQNAPSITAALRRRDLALEGYFELRRRVVAEGPSALDGFYAAAGALVRPSVETWHAIWRERVRAQVDRTGDQLARLADSDTGHLTRSTVRTAQVTEADRLGMCGRLRVWHDELRP